MFGLLAQPQSFSPLWGLQPGFCRVSSSFVHTTPEVVLGLLLKSQFTFSCCSYFIYAYGYCTCGCITCVPGALRGQERTLNALKLELQTILSYCVGAGNQILAPQSELLTAEPSISPVPKIFLY